MTLSTSSDLIHWTVRLTSSRSSSRARGSGRRTGDRVPRCARPTARRGTFKLSANAHICTSHASTPSATTVTSRVPTEFSNG